jgi:hypothetical protein
MALQLAPSERGEGSVYGGSQRGGGQRPTSSYYGGSGGMGYDQAGSRARSKSLAEPRQYTQDGRMILHYCKSSFLSFSRDALY